MEQALAIMMVLGIFVAIPCIIGFAIVGAVRLFGRKAEVARPKVGTLVEATPAVKREAVGAGWKGG